MQALQAITNRVEDASLRIPGVESYVFTGMQLGAGREFVIPRSARVSGRFTAGTRTIHARGAKGSERADA